MSPILVTGGDGQLGRDLVAVAGVRRIELVGLGRAELDITSRESIADAMEAIRPTAIIHAAAWTDVDGAEADELAALRVNGTGTANMVSAAEAAGIPIVYVSTDYVFDGTQADGYTEHDTPAPINAYGRSKLAGEAAVLEYQRGLVARTSWVFGEHGANFCRTIDRLSRERNAIDVVSDQVGCPTWSHHLAAAVLGAVTTPRAGIVHLVGEPVASWYDLAVEVVAHNGADCAVRPVSSDAFPRPAARPACSILRSTVAGVGPVGDWREGVRSVVAAWSIAS